MSDTAYLVWFIGMALATITILATTTLASAGLLRHRDVAAAHEPPPAALRPDVEDDSDAYHQERAA